MQSEEKISEPASANLERISKQIAYLLRHNETFIDGHGWADPADLIREIRKKYPDFNEELLKQIVREDRKGRYSFDKTGTRIRANQGHSVPVDLEFEKAQPPEILYHGTAKRFLPSIFREGLNGQSRLYVHLSTTLETARQVGSRHGKPVILKISTGQMQEDGYEFFLSENHVWLTKQVPPRYITLLESQ